jgi:hypothetical protein
LHSELRLDPVFRFLTADPYIFQTTQHYFYHLNLQYYRIHIIITTFLQYSKHVRVLDLQYQVIKFLTIYNVHIGVHLKMTERDLANLRCIFDLFKAGDFFGTLLYIFTFLKVN